MGFVKIIPCSEVSCSTKGLHQCNLHRANKAELMGGNFVAYNVFEVIIKDRNLSDVNDNKKSKIKY